MLDALGLHLIVSSRLSAIQRKELVEGFREGRSTSSLARAYGCSPNTVSRTVKTLLPTEEYNALKQARSKGKVQQMPPEEENYRSEKAPNSLPLKAEVDSLDEKAQFSLNENSQSFSTQEALGNESEADDFHEIVPLLGDFSLGDEVNIPCKPFSSEIIPDVVYLVVDRTVELDSKALSEFPELGFLEDDEKHKLAICLFSNQRSAKRHCGRNQRVIKIPDRNILNISRRFLLARGITRLILEGTLISLDEIVK